MLPIASDHHRSESVREAETAIAMYRVPVLFPGVAEFSVDSLALKSRANRPRRSRPRNNFLIAETPPSNQAEKDSHDASILVTRDEARQARMLKRAVHP
jgi:hypothetical protein